MSLKRTHWGRFSDVLRPRKRWLIDPRSSSGLAVGRIVRSDTGPTTILVPQTAAESEADRETAILNAVTTEPGKWSKSSLIEDKLKVPGRARSDWGRDG